MGYAEDVEFVARGLIEMIPAEELALQKLIEHRTYLFGVERLSHWDFETSDLNDDFPPEYAQAAHTRWAQAVEKRERLEVELAATEATIANKQISIQAICGALLQIAKQGVSMVHGGPDNAPDGRYVQGPALKTIIWQGRNQSQHFEDKRGFMQPVIDLFAELEQNCGDSFSLGKHAGKSLAKQVIHLLGWTDFEQFHSDMKCLGL